jgi:putative FmdB family regulatory protein
MPIYEYQCSACGHEFELIQKFSDPPVTECQACKGEVTKLISPSTFHLKGTGWYATDYANKPCGGSSENGSKTGDSSGNSKDAGEKVSSDSGRAGSSSSDSNRAGSSSSDSNRAAKDD